MTIRLNGATSGYTEIDAPSAAGNNTLILPTGNGSASQYLQTNGTGTLSWNDPFRMVLATAQNSTSGTNIDFTGIPSWVKRVTVLFNEVSTNSTSGLLVQIGAGSITSSGYKSTSILLQATGQASQDSTAGFVVFSDNASFFVSGPLTLTTIGSNIWSASGVLFGDASTDYSAVSSGFIALSGTLDRIRITTVGGSTFDNGSVNVLYEG